MSSYDEYGNYVASDDFSVSSFASVDPNIIQHTNDDNYKLQFNKNSRKNKTTANKYMDELKKQDKGFRKVKRNINGIVTNVEIYTTSTTPGSLIRDAITGSRYVNYRAGTSDENLFFKVRVSIGGTDYGNEPITLYYDNPETYERTFGSTVAQTDKERWEARRVSEVVSRAQ
uniref:Uncharacterized protein n=1 Tax=viral metagenome TaxID=1070528 RepID=A0A6C0DRZ6_9ZZZZ